MSNVKYSILKSIQDIAIEFGIETDTYLFYQTLVNAIPTQWKREYLNKNNNQIQRFDHPNASTEDPSKMQRKEMYFHMVNKKQDKSKACIKYTQMFDITNEEWELYYTFTIQLQVINKVKEMQYKILHDYVATNKLLYKMEFRSSPRCNFCNLYIQDTCHLFFECIEVKNFWFCLNEWLVINYDTPISVAVKTILFGDVSAPEIQKKVVLYAKLFIFKCKYKDVTPIMDSFIPWLRKYMCV